MNRGYVVVVVVVAAAAAVDAIAVADENEVVLGEVEEVVGNNAVLGDVDGVEPE